MKSETAGSSIPEFIALGSEQYAIETADDQIIKKAKGVKRHITMDDYKNALFYNKIEKREQISIQPNDHILHTFKRRKIARRSIYDKRVEIDNFFTLPHGHLNPQK